MNDGNDHQYYPDNLVATNTHYPSNHDVHPLGTYDCAGQAVQDPRSFFSANDINDGLNPHAIAPGLACSDNTYGGLGEGINNAEPGFSPYDNVAVPSFTSRAAQDAAGILYANNIKGGIYALSYLGHNGTKYLGDALGNGTAPGIVCGLAATNAVYGYGDHAIQPLETLGQVNHATQDLRPLFSANNINDGLRSSENDTAHGVTHIDNTYYGGVNSHLENIEAGISPYGCAASNGWPHRAPQPPELGTYPQITGNINGHGNLGHDDANHLGHSLGNVTAVTAPATAYGQSAYTAGNAAFLPQRRNIANGAYPTGNVSAKNSYPSNNAAATYDAGVAAQSLGTSSTPTTSSITLSPSTPGSAVGPDGRPRWACTACVKTFSRRADMERHAKKHSGVREFQCGVVGCGYKGSYRQDKLEQHRRNCH